jgi:hypothetical protein
MGIIVKKSTSNDGGSYGKLYTGAMNMKVVAINPTQAELQAMGFKAEKTPVYSFDKEVEGPDKKKVKVKSQMVKFYLEGEVSEEETAKAQLVFFVTPVARPEIFVDTTFSFGKDKDKLGAKTYNPFDGEIDLLLFLAVWLGHSKGDEFYLESRKKIVANGDVSELKQYMEAANNEGNEVKTLLGVTTKDNKHYQVVFSKKIEKAWSNNLSYLWKTYVEEYNAGRVKDNFGDIGTFTYDQREFALKEYAPGAATHAPVNMATAASYGSTNGQAVTDDESNEPPF